MIRSCVVVIATERELKLVKELGYDDCPIIITGIGGINVIRALRDLPKDTDILNIGYCGSVCLPVGTIVTVSEIHTLHENVEFKEYSPITFRYDSLIEDSFSMPCYTSTDFVTKVSPGKPCVYDMEFAFIRAMFDKATAIKVVSDNLSVEEYEENTKEGEG